MNHNPLDEKRESFIESLASLMEDLKMNGTLVFDYTRQSPVDYPIRHTSSCLEIIYAPSNLSADDYILEFLTSSNETQITLVSSDRDLCIQARNLGAHIKGISEFIDLLKKRKQKITPSPKETKPTASTDKEFQRFLALFEERYKNP